MIPQCGTLTACKYMVSDTFHSPHRGAFYLSLTVLVHYRSHDVFSLRAIVALVSHRLSRVPWYSREIIVGPNSFCVQDFHLLWLSIPAHSATNWRAPHPCLPPKAGDPEEELPRTNPT